MKSQSKLKLLTALSLVGLVTTTGTAIRCGDRLSNLYEIYIAELNYNHEETKIQIQKRYLQEAAKEICPTALLFGATALSIYGMYHEAKATEATLLSVLALCGGSANLYSGRDPSQKNKIHDTRKNEIWVYDGYSRTEFLTTKKKIDVAETRANKKLQQNYILRLSSVMHSLGTDVPDYCYYLGWEMSNEKQMNEWNRSGGPYIAIYVDKGNLYFSPEPEWLKGES